MTRIDDHILMAFADGELGAAEAAEVREALELDAALRERLEKISDADVALRSAVDPGSDMPDRFAQLLKPAAPVARLHRTWIPAGAALAAGLAMWVLGSALLSGPSAWLQQTDQGVALAGPVANAADNLPSGSVSVAEGLRIRPIVSFVADDGRACRDLDVRAEAGASNVLVCRDTRAGVWLVEAMAAAPKDDLAQHYQPAGGAKNPLIEAALAHLGVKSSMDAAEEGKAIERRWAN